MVIIGAFTKHGEIFSGRIRTLAVDLPSVQIIPNRPNAATDTVCGYRVLAGPFEIACGRRTGSIDREQFTLTLDDPSFPAPIQAHMIQLGDGTRWALVWLRRPTSLQSVRRAGDQAASTV